MHGMVIPSYAESSLTGMNIGKTFPMDSWQIESIDGQALSLAHVYRERTKAPLTKLSVGLIQTYKHINEVCSPISVLYRQMRINMLAWRVLLLYPYCILQLYLDGVAVADDTIFLERGHLVH